MSNTYDYKINDLQRDANGIVVAASFSITASDGEDSFTHNYHTAFQSPKDAVIPFKDLTEAKVIDWIKELVGKDSEEQADAELNAYKSRKMVTNGTPW